MRLLAAVLAAGAAAAGAIAAGPPAGEVAIPGKAYVPDDVSVLAGTTVTWRNGDAVVHTVTADDGSFDSGYLPPGGSYARVFATPGTYAFHCTVHRFMHGVVHVYAVVLTGPGHPLSPGFRGLLAGLAPPGVARVVLQRAGGGGWQPVGALAPAADGSFAFRVATVVPAAYRVVAGTQASPVVRVQVRPDVTVVRQGGALVVTTRPARPGAPVVLQTYVRERFAFVGGRPARLDGRGEARLPLTARRGEHVRVLVGGGDGFAEGRSAALLVPATA